MPFAALGRRSCTPRGPEERSHCTQGVGHTGFDWWCRRGQPRFVVEAHAGAGWLCCHAESPNEDTAVSCGVLLRPHDEDGRRYEQRPNAVMRRLRSLARPPILDMWFRTLNSFGVVSNLQCAWPSTWIDPSLMRRHAVMGSPSVVDPGGAPGAGRRGGAPCGPLRALPCPERRVHRLRGDGEA